MRAEDKIAKFNHRAPKGEKSILIADVCAACGEPLGSTRIAYHRDSDQRVMGWAVCTSCFLEE